MKDEIKEERERRRQWIVSFLRKHIDKKLVSYEEPQREGVPKGDPIGYPKSKMAASMWMVLYPHGLGLREIGQFVGTSYAVIGMWRHEEEFKKRVEKECDHWSRALRTLIENGASEILTGGRDDKDLVDLVKHIPFFADPIQKWVMALISAEGECAKEAKDETTALFWACLFLDLYYSSKFRDMKSFRKYARDPENKKRAKDSIKRTLDLITDPKTRKKFSTEEIKEATESVKWAVEFYIDLA